MLRMQRMHNSLPRRVASYCLAGVLACTAPAILSTTMQQIASAQTSARQSADAATSPAAFAGTLNQLQQTTEGTIAALTHLRIEKWKADGDTKAAAQSRVDSMVRNLTSALPALIQDAKKSPADVGVVFKLYRNLNALSDVQNSVSEAAEAFGPRHDAEALSAQTAALQNEQRSVADYLEQLAVNTQAQLARYQVQARPAVTPRRIIVDDGGTTTTTRKSHKKPRAAASPTAQ